MMSLSDNNEQFEPLSINNLDKFDDEVLNKTNKSDPDFDRFTLLFEESVFKKDEAIDFQRLYEDTQKKEEVVFKPLIEEDEGRGPKSGFQSSETTESVEEEIQEPEVPELSPEEKGFQEGVEKGLEEGRQQGKEKGYEEGFKKGEEEGFKKGEQDGIEKGHAEGFEKGVQEGEERGEADAKEKAAQFLSSLEQSLQTADQTLELIVDKYEESILDLIQQIAKKTIMAKIEMDDEIVKPMIIDALKALVQPEEIILNVSTDDYEYIEMIKDEFFEQVDSLSSVSVKSDHSIQKGDFSIETSTGMVSSDIESRLDTIAQALKTARRK